MHQPCVALGSYCNSAFQSLHNLDFFHLRTATNKTLTFSVLLFSVEAKSPYKAKNIVLWVSNKTMARIYLYFFAAANVQVNLNLILNDTIFSYICYS